MVLRDAFDRLAEWAPYVKPGNWPDDDMLPWGWLGPHPGWGDPRQSRETHDEQRTEFTLWAISRSPADSGRKSHQARRLHPLPYHQQRGSGHRPRAVESGPGLMPYEGWPDATRFPSATGMRAPAEPIPNAISPSSTSHDQPSKSDLPWMVFHLTDKPHAVYDVWNQKRVLRQELSTWTCRRTAAHCSASSNTAACAPNLGRGRNLAEFLNSSH